MITLDDWPWIRRLHLSEGVSKAQIARDLGVSRDTVDKAAASVDPPEYSRSPAVTSFAPFETSFLPGRTFDSPADFNTQVTDWLPKANSRTVRALQARPVEMLGLGTAAMLMLPPLAPPTGLVFRVRLPRDYYVSLDRESSTRTAGELCTSPSG